MKAYARDERRAAEARERRARRSGEWGPWRHHDLPQGPVGASIGGWTRHIRWARGNNLYAVMVRRLPTGVHHLSIRTAMGAEPPWRDLQRIKDELFGPEFFAVQVYPPRSRLVDEADMYHLWVMPEGYEPGFGLHMLDEPGR